MASIAQIRAEDAGAVRAFLTRLSPQTSRARYLGPMVFVGDALEREVKHLLGADPTVHTVLLARDGDDVRGIGEYVIDRVDRTRAEIAIVVEDEYQHHRIGTSLFLNLEAHALGRGIRAFTGEVANDNSRVFALLKAADPGVAIQTAYASSPFRIKLRGTAQRLAA